MDHAAAPAPAVTASPSAPGAARLPMVLTVGFTGHRTLADPVAAQRQMRAAFAEIGHAFGIVAASPLAGAYDGAPTLRLASGGAPGADRAAAAAWREAGLGEIHFVYPFKAPGSDDAFTDDPAHGDPATRVSPAPEFEPWTGFDAAGLGFGEAQAHAEVGRWIVRNVEVLVCWWNGEAGHGAGGTNDTLRRALERGLPVVWLDPDGGPMRLIDPGRARRHAEAAEAIADLAEIASPLDPKTLATILAPALFPPTGEGTAHAGEVAARLDYAGHDPMRPRSGLIGVIQRLFNRTLWHSFGLFETVCGRTPPAPDRTLPPPAAVAAQPGFARLHHAAEEAGARASHLGRVHRSEQLLLILIAIVAVFFGALPALVIDAVPGFHVIAAFVEFLLGVLAFTVAGAARMAHRHRRWSDARRLAERLRGALATWPLGFDIADVHAGPANAWTEWRAQAVLRAAGPRRGWITAPRFDETLRWSAGQLIDSQIAYHTRQHRLAETIEQTLKAVENGAFGLLMGTLASYIALTLLGPAIHWNEPHWFGGLVTLVSAVSPAIGAGCIALDATNGFGELRQHSAHLASEFEQLRASIDRPDGDAYHPALAVIRRGAQLLVEDADAWRDRLQRRRIVRGG
jgi:hypothetical protein